MSIERRLDRLEEARGDRRLNLVVYESDVELSAGEEAAFLKANIPDISPNTLVISGRRAAGAQSGPARVVHASHPSVTHEDALAHLRD